MEEYRDEVHGNIVQPGAYTVHRPDHWVFEGTKMAKGSSFGKWECSYVVLLHY